MLLICSAESARLPVQTGGQAKSAELVFFMVSVESFHSRNKFICHLEIVFWNLRLAGWLATGVRAATESACREFGRANRKPAC